MGFTQDLQGRHALVTGGARGIGAAIARQLVQAGASVTVLGRGLDAVAAVAAEQPERLHAVSADGSDAGQVAEEVADTVRWQCGHAASAIHGQSIAVCGGEVMP